LKKCGDRSQELKVFAPPEDTYGFRILTNKYCTVGIFVGIRPRMGLYLLKLEQAKAPLLGSAKGLFC
jgi:hypothetical protein